MHNVMHTHTSRLPVQKGLKPQNTQ
jgi:hypothetical protein